MICSNNKVTDNKVYPAGLRRSLGMRGAEEDRREGMRQWES